MQLANKIPFDDCLCHPAQVDDLSPLLVRDYLRRVGSRITLAEAEAMPFEQLCWNMQILGGTTETVHPKNVGVLFFCDNPELFIPCAHIEIVRFGEDVSSVFEEKILSGPIHVQLQQALDYLRGQVLIQKIVKVEGRAEAVKAWNYPYEALEEVVANAVYHKSWDERTPIEINIYPDRIEVFNVDGPMPPVTANDLRKERVVSRQYRNRRIGDFLKELDLTEGRNTGFPKIYSSLRKNGSPMPFFETDDTNSFFRATLPIHKAFMETDIQITGCYEPLNEPLNEPLKGVVLRVYQLIVARPGIKNVEIANNVKKSYASAKRYVKVLEDYHLVEYRDSKKNWWALSCEEMKRMDYVSLR